MVREIITLDAKRAQELVKLADKCDFDVNVGYDRIMVDARSIVGVMSLDLGRKLTISYEGESDQLADFCRKYAV